MAGALDADEILLGRDVLDTQVVDVVGQRLARVADVLLDRMPDRGWRCSGWRSASPVCCARLGLWRGVRRAAARTSSPGAICI